MGKDLRVPPPVPAEQTQPRWSFPPSRSRWAEPRRQHRWYARLLRSIATIARLTNVFSIRRRGGVERRDLQKRRNAVPAKLEALNPGDESKAGPDCGVVPAAEGGGCPKCSSTLERCRSFVAGVDGAS